MVAQANDASIVKKKKKKKKKEEGKKEKKKEEKKKKKKKKEKRERHKNLTNLEKTKSKFFWRGKMQTKHRAKLRERGTSLFLLFYPVFYKVHKLRKQTADTQHQ